MHNIVQMHWMMWRLDWFANLTFIDWYLFSQLTLSLSKALIYIFILFAFLYFFNYLQSIERGDLRKSILKPVLVNDKLNTKIFCHKIDF